MGPIRRFGFVVTGVAVAGVTVLGLSGCGSSGPKTTPASTMALNAADLPAGWTVAPPAPDKNPSTDPCGQALKSLSDAGPQSSTTVDATYNGSLPEVEEILGVFGSSDKADNALRSIYNTLSGANCQNFTTTATTSGPVTFTRQNVSPLQAGSTPDTFVADFTFSITSGTTTLPVVIEVNRYQNVDLIITEVARQLSDLEEGGPAYSVVYEAGYKVGKLNVPPIATTGTSTG